MFEKLKNKMIELSVLNRKTDLVCNRKYWDSVIEELKKSKSIEDLQKINQENFSFDNIEDIL